VRLTARVPATSANLGPGFDAFGLALDLCNEVTVDTDAAPEVTWAGEGADELPTDGSDMVSGAIAFAAGRRGARPPVFALHGVNRIPLESGLGSSSAAAVAGLAIAGRLLGDAGWEDPETTFAFAAELEGHPDNAAPAVFGGLTIVVEGVVHRFDPHPGLRPVLLVPNAIRLPTGEARRALPARVPIEDAVYNLSHAALLALAVTRDPRLLAEAVGDRLHEDVRGTLVPEMGDLLARLRRDGFPACVSGAGPSLLVFEPEGRAVPDPGEGWDVLRADARVPGAELFEG
jgi:homoserine kinase